LKITESHSARHLPDQQVFSLSPGKRVLLFTIILMSVGVAGSAGADLPPDLVDDGRGSYEMVDILAIAKRVVYWCARHFNEIGQSSLLTFAVTK